MSYLGLQTTTKLGDDAEFYANMIAQEIDEVGYARISPWQVDPTGSIRQSAQLKRLPSILSPDSTDAAGERARLHRAGCRLPTGQTFWEGLVDPISGQMLAPYSQPANYNPDAKGAVRMLRAIPDETLENPGLKRLLNWCVAATPQDVIPRECYKSIGLHPIQFQSTNRRPAGAVPNSIHVDNERLVYVFLLNRANISGGENFVTKLDGLGKTPDQINPRDVLAQFTLSDYFSGFVVDNERIAHFVEMVTALNDEPGWRTVLLVTLREFRAIDAKPRIATQAA